MPCRIGDFVRPEWIIPSLKGKSKMEVLSEIARHLEDSGAGIESDELLHRLAEREQKASTGADHGLAIPHATVSSTDRLIVAIARSEGGVEFGALDNRLSHLFFTVVNPPRNRPGDTTYLQAISAICRLMRSSRVRDRLREAENAQAIYDSLMEEESSRAACQ